MFVVILYKYIIRMDTDIIWSSRLVLGYLTCESCMHELARNLRYRTCIKLKGSCCDLDHIYIKWLKSGTQNVLRLQCPHDQVKRGRYYIKGESKIYLGEAISEPRTHDYHGVRVVLKPSIRTRDHILTRFTTPLLSRND